VSLVAYLRPGVRATPIDSDLALLDVGADAYVCLPEAGAAWRAGPKRPDGAALLAALRSAGLALDTPAPASPPPDPTLPRRRIGGMDAAPTRHDIVRLALALVDLRRGYHRRAFRDVLTFVRKRPATPTSADDPELRRLCAVFEQAVVWLPLSGKCLLRSFLLLRFLQRSGRDATWVFGVRLWPFAAHCWLQVEDVVLDDWPERLSPYTPIHRA
jgi:hypothetical protein